MTAMPAAARTAAAMVRLCGSGLEPGMLLRSLADRLRSIVPFDAACWSTVDPATLLPTGSVTEGLEAVSPSQAQRFTEVEFIIGDVAPYRALVDGPARVATLHHATGGEPRRSRRYRDVLAPCGWADELRATFLVDGACWGMAGLFRVAGQPAFTEAEAAFLARLGRRIAHGLRLGLLLDAARSTEPITDVGVLLLDDAGETTMMTPAAARWLAELPDREDGRLPAAVLAIAARTRALAAGAIGNEPARLRVRARSGRWLTLHGARLTDDGERRGATAIVIEGARPADLAPLLVQAYGLSPRERAVTALVLRGASSAEIARSLGISPLTVRDHLTSIFDKVGVRSRREVVARFLCDHAHPPVALE